MDWSCLWARTSKGLGGHLNVIWGQEEDQGSVHTAYVDGVDGSGVGYTGVEDHDEGLTHLTWVTGEEPSSCTSGPGFPWMSDQEVSRF